MIIYQNQPHLLKGETDKHGYMKGGVSPHLCGRPPALKKGQLLQMSIGSAFIVPAGIFIMLTETALILAYNKSSSSK